MKIKYPKKKSLKQIKIFFKKKGLNFLIDDSQVSNRKVNDMTLSKPLKPDLNDLYRLYQFVILNKRTTILELGSGWSTLIFSNALGELKQKYFNYIKKLRRNNPFELFVLENQKKYLKISKNRILKFNKKFKNSKKSKINYYLSNVEMTTFNNKIVTEYKKFPLCNPDFIYVDGPDQFVIKKDINGISTRHKDMMPMVSDILKIEYFLTPGTIIIFDGRAANALFLRDHLKRKWMYKNDKVNDQHIFLLNGPPLGKYNKLQLKFYKD